MIKGLTFFVSPSGFLICVLIAAAFWANARRSRASIGTFAGAAVLLLLAAFSPLGWLSMSVLEHRFPEWKGGAARVDGIVMLDGRIDRLPYDLALARAYPSARIVFSGKPEKDYDGFDLLRAAGLNASRALDDRRSRDTHENAVESLAIAKPKAGETWLLVTSASHMPRAMASFRAVGFPVRAAPVAFRTRSPFELFAKPASTSLSLCDDAFREVLSLLVYRMTGRTAEVWPGP